MEMIRKENKVALIDDDQEVAYMSWNIKNNLMYVNHTYTIDSYRGQGLHQKLLSAVIDIALEKNIKIIPVCSYVSKKFEQPEYNAVDGRIK